jgi:NAD(P)-dependent dehydrogenase (short-subunit alcohol dehydrogenase family)
MGICEGRVVIVTGAGRGLGRAHALEFARQGAKVVVNDLGTETDGSGTSTGPAAEVVAEIEALGGQAVANGDDVADEAGARRLVGTALEAFGTLHVLVNNAGFLRDRMLVNMSFDEWDSVIRVHLRGMFAPTRFAVDYWRAQGKAGTPVPHTRIVNTSSPTGLYGMVGQANYGAAKAGVAMFTQIAAAELGRIGTTVNAIVPGALTRMTAKLAVSAQSGAVQSGAAQSAGGGGGQATDVAAADPANVSPLVAWLGSELSAEVTGRVFNVRGGHISVAEGWIAGPSADSGGRWDAAELTDVVPKLVARARGPVGTDGRPRAPRPQAAPSPAGSAGSAGSLPSAPKPGA